MMAYWLDPAHNSPDIMTQTSERTRQAAQDQRTLRPVLTQGAFNLLNNAPANPYPYPYPYPGMMVSPGVMASPSFRSSNAMNPNAMTTVRSGRNNVYSTHTFNSNPLDNADMSSNVIQESGWNTVVQKLSAE